MYKYISVYFNCTLIRYCGKIKRHNVIIHIVLYFCKYIITNSFQYFYKRVSILYDSIILYWTYGKKDFKGHDCGQDTCREGELA